jgi:hypothetical protein
LYGRWRAIEYQATIVTMLRKRAMMRYPAACSHSRSRAASTAAIPFSSPAICPATMNR